MGTLLSRQWLLRGVRKLLLWLIFGGASIQIRGAVLTSTKKDPRM